MITVRIPKGVWVRHHPQATAIAAAIPRDLATMSSAQLQRDVMAVYRCGSTMAGIAVRLFKRRHGAWLVATWGRQHKGDRGHALPAG